MEKYEPKSVFPSHRTAIPRISSSIGKKEDVWRPDAVVLGPGGLKGFMELGALYKLEENGWLERVKTYVGVSIGSVISVLHLCGLSFVEISDIGIEMNLFDDWRIENIGEMMKGKGIVSPDHFRKTIQTAILTKMTRVPTMSELHKLTGKSFIAVSYNLTRKETTYFNRYSHPNMSVVEAVVASSSIPGVFYQYIYRRDVYIDGAFGNPYPIDILDDGLTKVLGLYISNSGRLNRDSKITETISAVLHAPIGEIRKRIIQLSTDMCKHIPLVNEICDVTGLQVNNRARIEMFRVGYHIGSNFITSHTPWNKSRDSSSDNSDSNSSISDEDSPLLKSEHLEFDNNSELTNLKSVDVLYSMLHGRSEININE
jgi:NTE family protein